MMTSALATTILSSVTAVAVTLLVNLFAIRRERDAEWRKLKLDRYQELIAALSEKVSSLSKKESQIRYANAVNALVLVAPSRVIVALYKFQDEAVAANQSVRAADLEVLLTTLISEIRKDIGPKDVEFPIRYRLFDIPLMEA